MPVARRVSPQRPIAATLAAALLIAPLSSRLAAQAPAAQQGVSSSDPITAEGYTRPAAVLERMIAAPRGRNVTLAGRDLSPDRRWFVTTRSEMPTLAELGKPHVYLAGLQVDSRANRARALTTRSANELLLVDGATGGTRAIETPAGARVSGAQWSPDGSRVAFLAHFDDATHAYVADVATGKSRRVSTTPLLATLVTGIDWAGSDRVVVVLVPTQRMAEPKRPAVEAGPLVRVHADTSKDYTRTYASLLRDPFEKALLEYHTTGQLATIDVRSRAVRRIGAPAMIYAVDASPDGEHFRVTLMKKPFSYVVQYGAFGQSEQLWDAGGKVVATLAERPLRETDGGDDAGPAARAQNDTARRSFQWLSDGALAWLRQDPAPKRAASDSGESRPPRRKDHLFVWAAPFAPNGAKVVLESDNRMGILFSDDAKTAFVAENANGVGTVYAVALDEPTKKYTITRVRGLTATVGATQGFGGGPRGGGADDSLAFYQNPGTVMTTRGRAGSAVALLSPDGRYAYLEGTRYAKTWSDSAPRPFVDRVEVKTGQKTRLFEGALETYEQVVAPLDAELKRVVTVRESRTTVPDYWTRELGASAAPVQLTHNVDYAPDVTAAQRKRIVVTRADGYKLWVSLTLPRDYRPGTRLPAMFWFYPYEYTDQGAYDRSKRAENVNRFPTVGPRSIEMLVTQGYAVVQPDAPIVGPQGRMNDNYVPDLRNNLAAVIDELDRQGYIDRQRLGLGGHSYGAFSTVNAMVHTPFFKAGIAGDGNYNRTLTPNGFQSERRDLWQGRETYLSMSPFLYADRLTGALLMYHSLEDQNVGTDPVNSIRLMHALQGMGKTASLYMYPYEDHGPIAKETMLDQWARWTAWLDKYVKNAGQGALQAGKTATLP